MKKIDICFTISSSPSYGALLSSFACNNSWLPQPYANGTTQVKVKKWLTAHSPPVFGDHSNGECFTIVDLSHSDHSLLLWSLPSDSSLNTLLNNMKLLVTKRIQFSRLLLAISDTYSGVLTSMSNSFPKMLSFKFHSRASASAQQHGLPSTSLSDMLEDSPQQPWLAGSWWFSAKAPSWVHQPTLPSSLSVNSLQKSNNHYSQQLWLQFLPTWLVPCSSQFSVSHALQFSTASFLMRILVEVTWLQNHSKGSWIWMTQELLKTSPSRNLIKVMMARKVDLLTKNLTKWLEKYEEFEQI